MLVETNSLYWWRIFIVLGIRFNTLSIVIQLVENLKKKKIQSIVL